MRSPAEYLEVLITLLAVSNAVGMIPVYLALSRGMDASHKRRTVLLATVTTLATLLVAALAGEAIFRFFSIGIPSFRVGGGLLILLTGLDMVRPKPESEVAPAKADPIVGVVPLGIPGVAGPGTITAVMIQAQEHQSRLDDVVLAGLIGAVALWVWCCFSAADPIQRRLGAGGIEIMSRVLGLVLVAMAVEFIATGLGALFPILRGGAA